ncbi:MAG: hypothetical protein GY862_11235 [Gammaproteobacteria bacterium]|nr:hypothetical protein [Gammaproteobacteria bacterium]
MPRLIGLHFDSPDFTSASKYEYNIKRQIVLAGAGISDDFGYRAHIWWMLPLGRGLNAVLRDVRASSLLVPA